MILLEVGNMDGILIFILLIMFGPPAILTIIGFVLRKKYKTAGIVMFILAALYLIIGLGICGSIL